MSKICVLNAIRKNKILVKISEFTVIIKIKKMFNNFHSVPEDSYLPLTKCRIIIWVFTFDKVPDCRYPEQKYAARENCASIDSLDPDNIGDQQRLGLVCTPT